MKKTSFTINEELQGPALAAAIKLWGIRTYKETMDLLLRALIDGSVVKERVPKSEQNREADRASAFQMIELRQRVSALPFEQRRELAHWLFGELIDARIGMDAAAGEPRKTRSARPHRGGSDRTVGADPTAPEAGEGKARPHDQPEQPGDGKGK